MPMQADPCGTCNKVAMDPKVMHALRAEAAAQALPIVKAMEEAFKEWAENRRYLRTGNGRIRFASLSRQMLASIEKRREEHEQQHHTS